MTVQAGNTSSATNGKIAVVLVAAGQSSRMHGVDKLTVDLAGMPVIEHSLKTFEACGVVRTVVVVAHASRVDEFNELMANGGFSKVVGVVAGGDRRQDSVRNGIDELRRIGNASPLIAVHDAARPFVDAAMLERGIIAAERIGAAIPVVPLSDTIKKVNGGLVVETPNRDELFSVQTPQVLRSEVLRAAHETVTADVTDDASMVELAGGLVGTFQGSRTNIKITTQSDIPVAQAIVRGSTAPSEFRYGIGFDGHRLVDGGPLKLGGDEIAFDQRLQGHSDGDVLLHTVASAILGAAGLGDLGANFPSNDPKYGDVDSSFFIEEANRLATLQGWTVKHVDATVIAQRPRLASRAPAFETNIAAAIGIGG